jgi:glycosyltransferase involved in cell wall biosynthesis
MKIGIISNLYPPFTRGGAEMIVTRTVGALATLGHDLFVISAQPRRLGQKITEDRSSGAERIYRFFPSNIYFTLDDFHHSAPVRAIWHLIDLFSARAGESVATICEWERPEAVITHNLKGLGLSVPRALQALKIPHIHVVHDLQLIRPSGLFGQFSGSGGYATAGGGFGQP